jgi:hypothetical protein
MSTRWPSLPTAALMSSLHSPVDGHRLAGAEGQGHCKVAWLSPRCRRGGCHQVRAGSRSRAVLRLR